LIDENKADYLFDKMDKNGDQGQIGEIDQAAYLQELIFGNTIIKNITDRFLGDNIFVLIFANYINDYLYDNSDLYLILISAFFDSNESIMEYELFGGELDETMKSKYSLTIFRSPFVVKTMTGFNTAMILKAFDTMIQQREYNELGDLSPMHQKLYDMSNSNLGKDKSTL